MTDDPPHQESREADDVTEHSVHRRRVLALGAGVGVAMLAGCSSGTDSNPTAGESPGDGAGSTAGSSPTTTTGDRSASTGSFRLLISDQPVAIDEFDELNVSFDRARIFRGDDDADDAETATETVTETETETETETQTETETETETATDTATPTETPETETETEVDDEDDEDDEEDDDGERGFFVIDLGGATVDLTRVVGEKAIGVFVGELPAGRYTKIELYAASVEGIVNGDQVEVKIPSGKLQIVKPFEVVASETVTFVFDINVVQRGNTGTYNLLPVISESGVAGTDVEVEEVDDDEDEDPDDEDDDADETDTEEPETETTETDEPDDDEPGNGGGQGPPDDARNNG